MTEEKINDKEPMTELLYRENKSELESEAEDSEYDSEEDEDSDKKNKENTIRDKKYKKQNTNQMCIKDTTNKKDITYNTMNTGIYI